MSPRWRYFTTDLRTNAPLAWNLPLSSVKFGTSLSAVGTFNATLQLGGRDVQLTDPFSTTSPGRTAVWAQWGDTLMWGGIIWGRRVNRAGQMTLDAKEFVSYFDRAILAKNATWSDDQLVIASYALTWPQSADRPGGDIGVTVRRSPATSGINRSRTWDATQRTVASSELTTLAAMAQGFDWAQDVYWDPDTAAPSKAVTLSYPVRGFGPGSSQLTWDDRTVVDWDFPEDALGMTTRRYGVGSGDGPAAIVAIATSPEMIAGGYPELEDVDQWTDIGNKDLVQQLVLRQQAVHRLPVTTPSVTVRIDGDPVLGAYTVGDWARIRLRGWNFPSAGLGGQGLFDGWLRIHGIDVDPQAMTATLTTATA